MIFSSPSDALSRAEQKCTIPGAIRFHEMESDPRRVMLMTAPFIPAILCAQSSIVHHDHGSRRQWCGAMQAAKIADSSGKLLGSTNADGSLAVRLRLSFAACTLGVRAGIQSPELFRSPLPRQSIFSPLHGLKKLL